MAAAADPEHRPPVAARRRGVAARFTWADALVLGFFATSVLGAVNDNILRIAVIVHAAMILPVEAAASIGLMAAGIFTLPFVLFSAFAGTLADRHEKAGIVRLVPASVSLQPFALLQDVSRETFVRS